MCLARHCEMVLLQRRFEQIKSGLQKDSGNTIENFRTHTTSFKTVCYTKNTSKASNSRFSVLELELDCVSLCAEYRLPFAVLAKNANRPLNYARQDSNL